MNDFSGFGVMINMLCGNNGAEIFLKAKDKKITAIKCEEDGLYLTLDSRLAIRIFDDGQSCCEHRYMTTDDDLQYYVGSLLLGATVEAGPKEEGEYDTHETAFLKISTSLGEFTVVTHNEHNGYYGGFYMKTEEVTDGQLS